MSPQLQTIAVIFPVSSYALDLIRDNFRTVHYYPEADIPHDLARNVEVWFCKWTGLPEWITFELMTATRIVQLTSAGANLAIKHPALQSPEAQKQISVCTASGIHVLSIPQWIIGMITNLYFNVHTSTTEQRWPQRAELAYRAQKSADGRPPTRAFGTGGFKTLRGKTAGMLGYGHIGRETARLLHAMGVNIIAANSSGERREDDGYIIDGTGDKDGSIPEKHYSSNDPASFREFLSRSDILIASLPSTKQTTYMLQQEHLDALPKDAIFLNVGRGDLVKSEYLLKALDNPEGLLGIALDVTDPEPLPDKHPLFSHPRVVITPHISADIEGYFDRGADLLLANVTRVRKGGKPMNVVDRKKGY